MIKKESSPFSIINAPHKGSIRLATASRDAGQPSSTQASALSRHLAEKRMADCPRIQRSTYGNLTQPLQEKSKLRQQKNPIPAMGKQ